MDYRPNFLENTLLTEAEFTRFDSFVDSLISDASISDAFASIAGSFPDLPNGISLLRFKPDTMVIYGDSRSLEAIPPIRAAIFNVSETNIYRYIAKVTRYNIGAIEKWLLCNGAT